MKTRVTELFGIKYPITCGGMFYFGEPRLCAAISNAGGLGSITAGNYDDAENLRAAIRETRTLTDKPFAVNITMLPSRITKDQYAAWYRVCCEENVAAIEASGSPIDSYVPQIHEAGIKLIQKVGSVRHALHAEKAGADALYVAGFEEGGHPLNDDVTTMVLIPRVAESVKIPIMATGGIADGRGLAAALALGADGVMMATRFLLTEESSMSDAIKKDMAGHSEGDTSIILVRTGLQARALDTELTDQVKAIEEAGGGIDDLRELITGRRIPSANDQGDVNGAVWNIGQSIGLIDDIVSCRELLDTMVADARSHLAAALAGFTA